MEIDGLSTNINFTPKKHKIQICLEYLDNSALLEIKAFHLFILNCDHEKNRCCYTVTSGLASGIAAA